MRWPVLGLIMTVAWAAAAPSSAQAEPLEYSNGHADIGLALEDGDELFLHFHFGGNAVDEALRDEEFEPAGAYVRVADSLKVTDAPLADVGLGTGTGDVWFLRQNNLPGTPFLGLGTEELDGSFGSANFRLMAATGPGEFSLWQGGFPNSIYWDTYDGIGGDDIITIGAGQHDHFNWGFTAPGVYELTLRGEQASDTGNFDEAVFTFVVGDLTELPGGPAVPEPGSLALLASFGCTLLGYQSLRRKPKAKC